MQTAFLTTIGDLAAKLSTLEAALRGAVEEAVGTEMLARIEAEIEDLGRVVRGLRRFEEGVKRCLRTAAAAAAEATGGGGGGGGGRMEVIKKVRDKFSPDMRDLICEMNLLAARVQFAGLQLVRMGSSRSGVPREQSPEEG